MRKQFGIWVPDKSLSDERGFINAGAVGAIAGSRRRSGGTAAIEFITGYSSRGSTSNGATGGLGFRFTVGSAGITVSHVGRLMLSGNSGSHTITLRSTTGTNLGSASVSMSGGVVDSFVYAALSSPVNLSASTQYYIYSDETSGGDIWYSNGSTIPTETSDATIDGSAYWIGANNYNGSGGNAYVYPSFKYTLT